MQVQCVLLFAVALAQGDKLLEIRKCCGAFEMLSGDGQSCEDAPWLPAPTAALHEQEGSAGAPLDAQWLSRWLQPGLSPDRVGAVLQHHLANMRPGPLLRAVWTEEKLYGNRSVAPKELFLRGTDSWLLVPGSDSFELGHASSNMYDILLRLEYCMDAASFPLRPFELLVEPVCDVNLCITKCCPRGQVVMTQGGRWTCDSEERGDWWQAKSCLIDLQEPFFLRGWNASFENVSGLARDLTLDPEEAWAARLLRDRYHFVIFSGWDACIDLKRSEDGTLRYTLFYWENSRGAGSDNGMPRYLYFVPVALLVVSLCNIVRDRGFRTRAYAFPMYFMLMAANCWRTAVCIHTDLVSFRKFQSLLRGNSVLQREVNQEQEEHQTKKQNSCLEETFPRMKLYFKMFLMSGIIETLLEFTVWMTCYYSNEQDFLLYDHMLLYRAACYLVDVFRTAFVAWSAAQVEDAKWCGCRCKTWSACRGAGGGEGGEELEMRVLGEEASAREAPGGET
ncbi:Protein of unknown function [Gryllus bimaculatus]|nr:Protein of unknown function [Gryllus bimaculatus]